MNKEPSDIIALLRELGDDDLTCWALAAHGEHGEPILNLCYAAINALAKEKALANKQVMEFAALMPPKPVIVPIDQIPAKVLKKIVEKG